MPYYVSTSIPLHAYVRVELLPYCLCLSYFLLHFRVFLLIVLRLSSALLVLLLDSWFCKTFLKSQCTPYLLYYVLYFHAFAAVVFLLSLCTQPPCSVVVSLQEMLPLFVWFAWRRTAVPLASSSVPVGWVLFVGIVVCTCCLYVLSTCV